MSTTNLDQFLNSYGRKRIYTDETYIDEKNLFDVINKTLPYHETNKSDISSLLEFEKGNQPLVRDKIVREDIDIKAISNVANKISEFKLGYFWGNPVSIVQKSTKNPLNSKIDSDNEAITLFNDMFFSENKDSVDQETARYIEICGVGYQMLDIKRDPEEYESLFDLVNLNPLFTYIVYGSDIHHKPMLGVTYVIREDRTKFFTCYTKEKMFLIDSSFKIINGVPSKEVIYSFGNRSGEANPIGEIPIIEFNRSFDRTGCFERQIGELNALNVMKSDLANDISQNTQAFWWGNDIELDEDENGKVDIKGGSWMITKTNGNGSKPDIKSLTLEYQYTGIIQNIELSHDQILENAYVPKQTEASGGSTGTAMSMTSGWAAAEAVACKEELVLKKSFLERNRIAWKIVNKINSISPNEITQKIITMSPNDIDVKFTRQKTFDMATKVNSLSTLIKNFVDPAEAIKVIGFFPDEAETINSSYDNMKKYQEMTLEALESKNEKSNLTSNNTDTQQNDNTGTKDRIMQDSSDQEQNSPISSI